MCNLTNISQTRKCNANADGIHQKKKNMSLSFGGDIKEGDNIDKEEESQNFQVLKYNSNMKYLKLNIKTMEVCCTRLGGRVHQKKEGSY